jgi:glycine cleavage system H protein
VAEINKCNIPEDLYYDVDKHVWARLEGDGTVTVGMTDPAQSRAGAILYAHPKRVGATLAKGKSTATVESGKWVGPVPAPFTGEVVAANDDLNKDGSIINKDPYGAGWIVKLKPADLEAEKAALVYGKEGVEAYRKKLQEENYSCAKE